MCQVCYGGALPPAACPFPPASFLLHDAPAHVGAPCAHRHHQTPMPLTTCCSISLISSTMCVPCHVVHTAHMGVTSPFLLDTWMCGVTPLFLLRGCEDVPQVHTHTGRQCHTPTTYYSIAVPPPPDMGHSLYAYMLHTNIHGVDPSNSLLLLTDNATHVTYLLMGLSLSDQHTRVHRPRVRWQKGGKAGCGRSKKAKAYSTSTSRVVPHHSTTLAVHRLTSRFGWDVVYSASYGRKRL